MKYDGYYAVMDIETGGFSKTKNPICEICIIILNNKMKVMEKYNTLIKDYIPEGGIYTKDAENVHGITQQEIRTNGTDAKEVITHIITMFKKYTPHWTKRPILVGHNMITFDAPYVASMFEFFNKDFYKTVNTYIADTMWIARDKWGHIEKPNHQLRTCCDEAGIELLNAHRAEADTEATMKLFKYFNSCLREEGVVKLKKKEEAEAVKEVKYRDTFQF